MQKTTPQPHPHPYLQSDNTNTHQATFSYFSPQALHKTEKPYEILINLPPTLQSVPRTNFAFEDFSCVVQDVRGQEEDFSLDTHGFAWRKLDTALDVADFQDREKIEGTYLPEIESFLRRELHRGGEGGGGIERICIFDWKLRVSQEPDEFAKRTVDLEDGLDPLLPTQYPHIDQSGPSASNRAHFHLPDEAAELLKGRYRIINVWRPLKPIKSWPLAVCDAKSVQRSDLIEFDLVRRKYIGESYFAKYSPEHRWYYLGNQCENEVVMLKIFDSEEKVDARFCVHASFKTESPDIRESIEVRAMVFSNP